jgi:hypothetical protein
MVNVAYVELVKWFNQNLDEAGRSMDPGFLFRRNIIVEFLKSFDHFKECVSLLKQKYGQVHSDYVLENLLEDFVHEIIGPLDCRKNERISQSQTREKFDFLVSELEKPSWVVSCIAPLFNFEWEVGEEDEEFKLDGNLVTIDEDFVEQRLIPGVRIVLARECELDDVQDVSHLDPRAGKVRVWCEIEYEVPRSRKDYSEVVDEQRARNRMWRALLAMRLFQTGDVGSSSIVFGFFGSTWQKFVQMLGDNFNVPSVFVDHHMYRVSLKERTALQLMELADQLDFLFDQPSIGTCRRILIGCENFMTAYSKGPVDRIESYLRCLQALFSRTKAWPLGSLTSKFLAQNNEQLTKIRKDIVDSYELIRTPTTHGLKAPSVLEKEALRKIPYIEKYCRDSILLSIALERFGQFTSLRQELDQLNGWQSQKRMLDVKRKAFNAFWSDRRIITTCKGNEILLSLW